MKFNDHCVTLCYIVPLAGKQAPIFLRINGRYVLLWVSCERPGKIFSSTWQHSLYELWLLTLVIFARKFVTWCLFQIGCKINIEDLKYHEM